MTIEAYKLFHSPNYNAKNFEIEFVKEWQVLGTRKKLLKNRVAQFSTKHTVRVYAWIDSGRSIQFSQILRGQPIQEVFSRAYDKVLEGES